MTEKHLIGIVHSLPYGSRGDFKEIDSSYVLSIGAEVLGKDNVRFGSSPMVADIARELKRRDVSGLIVTQGHGDINAIKNLEDDFGGPLPKIPIFEACRVSGDVHEEYRTWLLQNFK